MSELNLIRISFLSGNVPVFLLTSTFAPPAVRQGSGANATSTQAMVNQFRAPLGGTNKSVGGSFSIPARKDEKYRKNKNKMTFERKKFKY